MDQRTPWRWQESKSQTQPDTPVCPPAGDPAGCLGQRARPPPAEMLEGRSTFRADALEIKLMGQRNK